MNGYLFFCVMSILLCTTLIGFSFFTESMVDAKSLRVLALLLGLGLQMSFIDKQILKPNDSALSKKIF